ncbi:MAG: tetratricopeptide repeat protein [Actinobacteria bacterium]|nr:tetratricopeptide repeat protein [Actinomycetota bacterium]
MNRWTSLLLKAVMFVLVVAILATVTAITRYALFDDKLKAPRTEAERTLFLAVEAVKANPNDAIARIKLAAAYLEVNQVNKAMGEAKIATRLAPKNPEAFYILGIVNREKGNAVQAAQNLEKAAKLPGQLAPFYQACWSELANIYMGQKKYSQAIRAYDSALGYGPEAATLLYDLARAYELSKDTTSAIGYYKEVLEFLPDHTGALESLKRLEKETAAKNKNNSTAPATSTAGK